LPYRSSASTAWSILKIVGTAAKGGTSLLVRTYWSIRKGRGWVKKAKKRFQKELVNSGIPDDIARQIANSYADPGLEILSIRNMINLARELEGT
jgi:hypothetical protein